MRNRACGRLRDRDRYAGRAADITPREGEEARTTYAVFSASRRQRCSLVGPEKPEHGKPTIMSSDERLTIAKPAEHAHGLNAAVSVPDADNDSGLNSRLHHAVPTERCPQRGSDSMQISPSQIIAECQEISRRNEVSTRLFASPRAEDQITRLESAIAGGQADPAVKLALQWWRLEQAMAGHEGDIPEALSAAQSVVERTLWGTRATTPAGLEAKLRIALVGSLPEGVEMDPQAALILSAAEDAISLEIAPAAVPMAPPDTSLDAGLLHMEAMAAEEVNLFNSTPEDDERGLDQWHVYYAGLCQTPAWTLAGLAVKVRALMTEITEGESFCGADLRRTTAETLARLVG